MNHGQLESINKALLEALVSQDWTALAKHDAGLREALAGLVDSDLESKGPMRQQLSALLGTYRNLVDACASERRKLREELMQLNQAKRAAGAYKLAR